jgi:undecaprenyl-diphosphatase
VPAFLATVVTSQLIVTNVIKVAVGRERPNVARLVAAQGFSFPSGHTAASAAAYAAIALVVGRRRSGRTKAVLGGAAAGVAVAVAMSRVLLGAHWLTDVIAGAFVGWACFALCSIAFGGRLLRFGAPVEAAEAVLVAESRPGGATVSPTIPILPTKRQILPPTTRSHP